jgi:serine/threonine protein kinase
VNRPPYEPSDDDDDSNAPIPDQFDLTDFLDVEDLERYAPGGFHPVHIGDTFNHRYKVIHKLGSGGFATIWLARDRLDSRYVALKIVAADASDNYRDLSWVNERLQDGPGTFFTAAVDSFRLQGPNGRHFCEVMPVLGPSMARLSGYDCRLRPWAARRMGLQIAQALALLHSQGLCHGGE